MTPSGYPRFPLRRLVNRAGWSAVGMAATWPWSVQERSPPGAGDRANRGASCLNIVAALRPMPRARWQCLKIAGTGQPLGHPGEDRERVGPLQVVTLTPNPHQVGPAQAMRAGPGEDPVPRGQRAARAAPAGQAGVPRQGQDGSGAPGDTRDLAWSLRQLGKDPSLRYTDPGRALLRWLEAHACGPRRVAGLIDMAPSHCGYLVADIARECARQWQELATALDQRLRAGHTGSHEPGAVLAGQPPPPGRSGPQTACAELRTAKAVK